MNEIEFAEFIKFCLMEWKKTTNEELEKMTIKFTISHTYQNVPIEITVEARDVHQLDILLKDTIKWLIKSQAFIDECITSLPDRFPPISDDERRRP